MFRRRRRRFFFYILPQRRRADLRRDGVSCCYSSPSPLLLLLLLPPPFSPFHLAPGVCRLRLRLQPDGGGGRELLAPMVGQPAPPSPSLQPPAGGCQQRLPPRGHPVPAVTPAVGWNCSRLSGSQPPLPSLLFLLALLSAEE